MIIAGYIVMGVAMIFQWLRLARSDGTYRATALTYVATIGFAQLGWMVLLWLDLALAPTLAVAVVLILVEMAGPFIAETRQKPTPWHPHHVAERYGC